MTEFELLGEFLREDEWYPTQIEGKTVYRMGFTGRNTSYTCFARVREEYDQVLFYVMLPNRIEEAMRPQIAEFITRANYGLRIGNFEMDYSDGEVRYKTSLDYEGETLTHGYLKNMIYPAIRTMDQYYPGIMAVLYGGKSVVDAIEAVEA